MTAAFHSKRINIGAHKLNKTCGAKAVGPTVLMIHGIGVSSAYYRRLMVAMGKKYHVVALDMPGYGGTPQPDHDLSINELAEIVNEYVRSQSVERCILIGHSMGTQVVIEAAKRAPKLYDRIVLMAPTINKRERHFLLMAWRLFQDTLRERWSLNYIVFRDYLKMGIVSYLRASRSMFHDHIEKDIAAVSLPILIMAGERDKISPIEWCNILASRAENATVEIIKNAPHNFQYHSPREVAAACTRFIS